METFKNSQSRQGSHSGDKSDSPWRWFRSCHAKDVISGRGRRSLSPRGQEAGPLATAQPPGPPTLSGWHSAASQADWLVSRGTSVWRRGCQDTLSSPDPVSPHPPARQHPCWDPFPLQSDSPAAQGFLWVPVECRPSFPGHGSHTQTPVQLVKPRAP